MLRAHVGWGFAIGASLSVVALAACVGEDPDGLSDEPDAGAVEAGTQDGAPGAKDDAGPSDDADADGGGTGPDGGCTPIPGNLVVNGSFENGKTSWIESEGTATVRMDGPADCLAFVELETTASYGRLHQNLDLSSLTPGAMGTVEVEVGASVRSLDDNFGAVELVLGNNDANVNLVEVSPALSVDGGWVTFKKRVTITPGTGFYIRIQTPQPRKIGIDRVFLVRTS